jgi:hypothetical protein
MEFSLLQDQEQQVTLLKQEYALLVGTDNGAK